MNISILGDSISTYEGYNPIGYSVFYDESMRKKNGLQSVDDTWWAKVIRALNGKLCVNNSYSGSRVTGCGFPSGNCKERISELKSGEIFPDLILIYIGFNDFGNGITAINTGARIFKKKDPLTFEGAYETMIRHIRRDYPKARIICGTLMRTKIKENAKWQFPEHYAGIALETYNHLIRKTAAKYKCGLADLSNTGIHYETLDGTHPTATGHSEIADAWLQCI